MKFRGSLVPQLPYLPKQIGGYGGVTAEDLIKSASTLVFGMAVPASSSAYSRCIHLWVMQH
jgi:hypothetical protein